MGAKPNRKSRHGLHKANLPHVVIDFETFSASLAAPYKLYPHQRDAVRVLEDVRVTFPHLGARTGRTPLPPEIQTYGYRFGTESFRAAFDIDFSRIEAHTLATLIGIDMGEPGGDRTAFVERDADGNWRDIGTLAHSIMEGLPDFEPQPIDAKRYRKD